MLHWLPTSCEAPEGRSEQFGRLSLYWEIDDQCLNDRGDRVTRSDARP